MKMSLLDLFSTDFLDLIVNFAQPATLVYVGYLIWVMATSPDPSASIVSLALIGGVFGLQVILFLMKMEMKSMGWMLAVSLT